MSSPATRARSLADLTPRQRDVAELAARGCLTKEIARQLGISHKTVRNCITVLFQRTGCERRVELTRWVLRHQLTWQLRRLPYTLVPDPATGLPYLRRPEVLATVRAVLAAPADPDEEDADDRS